MVALGPCPRRAPDGVPPRVPRGVVQLDTAPARPSWRRLPGRQQLAPPFNDPKLTGSEARNWAAGHASHFLHLPAQMRRTHRRRPSAIPVGVATSLYRSTAPAKASTATAAVVLLIGGVFRPDV